MIYELARIENAVGDNYDERIKSLKQIRSDVEPDYFDTLLTIQQVTCDKVHEESYDGWTSVHLRALLSTLSDTLNVMYVIPKLREKKRAAILAIKAEIAKDGKDKAGPEKSGDTAEESAAATERPGSNTSSTTS